MAATVVIATLFLFLSGNEPDLQVGEPITEAPAVQEMFIEVNVEPIVVQDVEIVGDGSAAVVENPATETPAETREPIGTDVEPLDQIEPLFVEEVVAEPQPVSVEQSVGDQAVPTVEPVAEPIQIVEPEIVPVPETAPIFENTDTILGPQDEAVAETVGSPSVEVTEPAQPAADVLQTVEPVIVEPVAVAPVAVEPVTVEPVTVEPAIAEPVAVEPTIAEPVAAEPVAVEPVAVEPANVEPVVEEPVVEEKSGTYPEVPSDSFEEAASGPATAANADQAVEPAIVPEPENAAAADQSAIDEPAGDSNDDTAEPVVDPFEAVEPSTEDDAKFEIQTEVAE